MRVYGWENIFLKLRKKIYRRFFEINPKTSQKVFPHNISISVVTPATSNFKHLVNPTLKFVRLWKGKFSFERFERSRQVSRKTEDLPLGWNQIYLCSQSQHSGHKPCMRKGISFCQVRANFSRKGQKEYIINNRWHAKYAEKISETVIEICRKMQKDGKGNFKTF